MKRFAVINSSLCAACGVCVKGCPKDALSIYRGCYAWVNGAKCVGCGLCSKACPAGAIFIAERSLANEKETLV